MASNLLLALTPAERARQLGRPEGRVGLAVAEMLNESNRQSNEQIVRALGIRPRARVLEIGFGNGRAAPDVIAQAMGVRYAGLDISPTMVEEAARYNAAHASAGQASFHLASAESMPFDEGSFDHVFSVGVIHFWERPDLALAETRRMLRPGGNMLMACMSCHDTPEFARPEFGVYLRDAETWHDLCRAAGFSEVDVLVIETDHEAPGGGCTRRMTVAAQALKLARVLLAPATSAASKVDFQAHRGAP